MFDPFLSDYRPQNSRVLADFGSDFGEVLGQKSLADVQDFLTSVRYRMQQMAAALGQVDPSKVKDHSAFASLMVDAGNLKTRVSRADAAATAAISSAVTPLAYTPAQAVYDGLVKAMRQNAPPDGAPLSRGDYVDVVNRIKQVGGVAVDLSQVPQPRAADPDRTFLNQSAPLAYGVDAALAAARAAEEAARRMAEDAAKKPREAFDFFHWLREHETEILVAGAIVSALWLYSIFSVGKAAMPYVLPVAKQIALGGRMVA